jgi:hypothetical protein
MAKVISLSFFICNELKSDKYIDGFKEMIKTRDKHFPGWVIWLYVDETVPNNHETIILANGAADVIVKFFNFPMKDAYVKAGARALPCHEADQVDVFISRDIDSPLTELDAKIVRNFLTDTKAVVLRYHEVFPYERYLKKIGGSVTKAKGVKRKYNVRSCEEVFPEIRPSKDTDYYTHPDSFIGGGLGVKLRASGSPESYLRYEDFMIKHPDLLKDSPQRRGYDEHYFAATFAELPNQSVEVVMMRGKRSGQLVLFEDVCNAEGSYSKKIVPSLIEYVYSK